MDQPVTAMEAMQRRTIEWMRRAHEEHQNTCVVTIASLQERIAELEAENARLREVQNTTRDR